MKSSIEDHWEASSDKFIMLRGIYIYIMKASPWMEYSMLYMHTHWNTWKKEEEEEKGQEIACVCVCSQWMVIIEWCLTMKFPIGVKGA